MSLRPNVEVAIAGVGETAVGKLPGQHSTGLYVEAAKRAIEDAGIDKSEIDGLLTTASVVDDNVRHHMVISEHLGLFCKTLCDTLRTGGAAFGYAFQLAQWAVQSGRCRAVLVVAADNLLTGPGLGQGVTAYTELGAHSLEFEVPLGRIFQASTHLSLSGICTNTAPLRSNSPPSRSRVANMRR